MGKFGWRSVASLTGGFALLVLAALLGVLGAVTGFLLAAAFTSNIPLLCASGLTLCACLAAPVGWLAARIFGRGRKHYWALGVGSGALMLVAVAASLTVFKPLVDDAQLKPFEVPEGVDFWNLSTGSRIAYKRLAASPPATGDPVIYLHGGPGAGVVSVPKITAAFSFPVALGHDVYLYDQVGGGLSERLQDITEYTVSRHLADLEAIRQRIDAETVVLIGESWGAELAVQYLIAHPRRVVKLVLVSPGPLYPAEWGDIEPCELKGRLPEESRAQFERLIGPRLLAALLLAEINPQAAHAFLPDNEGDAFVARLFSLLAPGGVCNPAEFPSDADFGFGAWGNLMTDSDNDRRGTRFDQLLAEVEIPVLILRGDCDYCRPEVASQYASLLPTSSLVEVPEAGHFLWLDKPDVLSQVAGSFLSGGSVP